VSFMAWLTCPRCGGSSIGGLCSKCRAAGAQPAHASVPHAETKRPTAPRSKSFDKVHQADTLAEAHERARGRLEQKGLPDFVTEGYVKDTVDPKLQAIAKAYASAQKALERAAAKRDPAAVQARIDAAGDDRAVRSSFAYVRSVIEDEGFDAAFASYTDFKPVKDPAFQAARRAYLAARKRLVTYLDANV